MGTRHRVRQSDRPAVTRADLDAAIAAIVERHLADDAAYAEELSEDPHEMYFHLRKRSIDFSHDLRRKDYRDAVVIARWIAEVHAREVELWALEQGLLLGLSNRQVGEPYGLTSRQGVPDRIRTLRRRVRGAGADVLPLPVGLARQGSGRPTSVAERELEWLATHRGRILALARELLAYEDLADDDAAEWLAEVRRDADDAVCTPSSFRIVGIAVDDLAASPSVLVLESGHALLTLIREWRSLANDHRNVSREPGPTGPGNVTSGGNVSV